MSEVCVTFKAGQGFEAPWVVIRGESVAEVDAILGQWREVGGFTAVKTAAAEFHNAPVVTADQAVASVQASFPAAQVVHEPPAEVRQYSIQPVPAEQPRPPLAQQYQPTPPVQQSTPPCQHCGAPTRHKSGNGSTGPWSAYMCSSGNRQHTQWLK